MSRSRERACWALAALALLAGPAAADAGFTPPAPVAAGDALVDLAVGPDGTTAALWNDGTELVAGVRPRGGGWDVETVGAADPDAAIAVGPGGAVVVAAFDADLHARIRTGADFGPPETLGAVDAAVAVAVRSDGTPLVAWRDGTDVVVRARDGAWGADLVGPPAAAPTTAAPVLVTGPENRAAVAWDDGAGQLAVAAGPGFDAPETFAGTPDELGAAYRADGGLDLVWRAGGDVRTGRLGTPGSVGIGTGATSGPAVAPGVAAFAGAGRVHAARVIGTGALSDTAGALTETATGAAVAGALPGGRALVAWPAGDALAYRIVGDTTIGGTAPVDLDGAAPAFASDPASPVGALAWAAADGRVHASVYDDAPATVDVQAPPAPPSPPPPGVFGSDVLADRSAPLLGGLKLTHTTFRIDGGQTAMSAQRRARPVDRGTQVLWTLNEPATVYLAVEKLGVGWRGSGSVCALRRRSSTARRCTRLVVMGQLVRRGKTGRNGMRFTGRFGRHALSPGQYRFAVFARDAAGNTSPVKRLSFTLRE
jgi:hypothetical protein